MTHPESTSLKTVSRYVAALFLGMAALKLTVMPEWSWWWVTAPYWFWLVIWGCACVGLVVCIMAEAVYRAVVYGGKEL